MATFSQSSKDLFIDYYCAPCLKHNIDSDQLGDQYCKKCLKAYCEKCIIKHKKKFPKHKPYGKDEPRKWPVPRELPDSLHTHDLRKGERLEIVYDSQRQCVEVSVQDDSNQVFSVQGKSEYNVSLPRDSTPDFDIQAICVLSDDQILVAVDWNTQVKLLDQQYQVVGHCDLNACPTDMCLITPSEVAVAMREGYTHLVQFVSVDGGRLVKGKKLQFQHRCFGIAYNLQDLYLTSGTALYKYSMSGELLNKMYEHISDTHCWPTVKRCAVSPAGDKIFVTNFSQHKVLTLDRDGTLLHTFTDPDLSSPCGIHVTALGQVLVCGYGSDTFIQLDSEGKKKLATIATKSDGLNGPWSACYNIRTASIIVGQLLGKQILVFEVK